MTRRTRERGLTRLFALVAVLALVTPSCGAIAYDRAWSRFDAAAIDGEGGAMVGRWKGEWASEWNGHSGGLRCMMTRADDGGYCARFYSTFGWFFFFRHETVFEVVGVEGGTVRFEGEEDLGETFGGVYRYQGTVAGDRFEAEYDAENGDHGRFTMQRVE